MAKSVKKKSSSKNEKAAFIKAFTISAVASLLIFFVLTAIFSFFALKQDLSYGYYPLFMLLSCLISGFLCGFICVIKTKKNGLISGMLCVMPVYLVIIMISIIVSTSGIGLHGWIALGIMMLSSGFGGIVSANRKKKTKIK